MFQRKGSLLFAKDLIALWPGLPYLGLGILSAWILLSYSGTFWLSDTTVDGRYISQKYLTATSAFALLSLIAPLLPVRIKQLFNRTSFVYLGALLAGSGALLVIFAGPFYLNMVLMFYIGSVLTGIGALILTLRCGQLYSQITPAKVVVYVVVSQVFVVSIYYLLLGTEWYYPIGGGPSLSGIIGLAVLPIFAATCMSLSDLGASRARPEENETSPQATIKQLPIGFWKMCVAVMVFALVTSVVRGYNSHFASVDAILINSNILMLLRLLFAGAFVYLAFRTAQKINFGRLYLMLMVGISIAVTLGSAAQVYGGGFALFITFSLDIFDILLWCLLAFVVFQGHTSSVVVFGFGRGVFTLGGVLGWAIGVWLLPNILVSPWASIFFVLMATLVIICAVLVFSEKDFDQLFSTALPSKLALNEFIRNSFISTAQLEAENEPGSSSHIEACKEIARTFNLTEREQDIFNLLARGRGSEIIALRLQISLNTVRSHTQNIYIKTGVHSRNELIEMVEFIQQNGDSGRV